MTDIDNKTVERSSNPNNELLRDVCIWLRSALDCKDFVWDFQQWNAADDCERRARESLRATHETPQPASSDEIVGYLIEGSNGASFLRQYKVEADGLASRLPRPSKVTPLVRAAAETCDSRLIRAAQKWRASIAVNGPRSEAVAELCDAVDGFSRAAQETLSRPAKIVDGLKSLLEPEDSTPVEVMPDGSVRPIQQSNGGGSL